MARTAQMSPHRPRPSHRTAPRRKLHLIGHGQVLTAPHPFIALRPSIPPHPLPSSAPSKPSLGGFAGVEVRNARDVLPVCRAKELLRLNFTIQQLADLVRLLAIAALPGGGGGTQASPTCSLTETVTRLRGPIREFERPQRPTTRPRACSSGGPRRAQPSPHKDI